MPVFSGDEYEEEEDYPNDSDSDSFSLIRPIDFVGSYNRYSTKKSDMSQEIKSLGKNGNVIKVPLIGDIIKSRRKFGIEFEMTGKRASILSLNSVTPDVWGRTSDSSIRTTATNRYAIEVQTSPLSGKRGEEDVFSFCSKARKAGFIVNTSCGTHVHIEGGDIYSDFKMARRTMALFSALDGLIYHLTEPRRRDNPFCSPTSPERTAPERHTGRHSLGKGFFLHDVLSATKREELEAIYYGSYNRTSHYSEARYYNVNFHRFFSSPLNAKTIEIRNHEGTLDGKEILQWASLFISIVDNARRVYENDLNSLAKGSATEVADYLLKHRIIRDNHYKYVMDRIKSFTK